MRRFLVHALTTALRLLYSRRTNRFLKALETPAIAQEETLRRILKGMEKTRYGSTFGLSRKLSIDEFRDRVPLQDYEALQPWIERQSTELESVLVPDKTTIYELTSGSRGPAKWIPYNRAHLKTFESMFLLWAMNLFSSGLKLKTGKVFFLISPKQGQKQRAASGVPVGFRDDTDYLSGFVQRLTNFFFIPTPELHESREYLTDLALTLVNERDLEVISVWSPSLLLLALDRAKDLKLIQGDFKTHWPHLKLISCWDSATSKADADALRALFPYVHVQGKGLLATEVAMTVPWSTGHQLPLIEDIYYEFIDERPDSTSETTLDKVVGLHELVVGKTYEIVTTAPNGFLRYRMDDRVRCTGFFKNTPSLEFVGRRDSVSDLVGEKLSSSFVETLFDTLDIDDFALVLPNSRDGERGYLLVTSQQPTRPLVHSVENAFKSQHHYQLASQLGQIAPLKSLANGNLRQIYYDALQSRGVPAGQVKKTTLVTDYDLASAILDSL